MQNGCGSTEKGQEALQTRSQFYNNTSIWKKKWRGKQQQPKKISISMDRES